MVIMMHIYEKKFLDQLHMMGIDAEEKQLSCFHIYYENLSTWNQVMNLTAITDVNEVYEKHFLDSLSIIKAVSKETMLEGFTMIDVGTGAGFPGLPIAVLFPNIQVVLMDSLGKRIKFLDDTISKLHLTNVKTVHARAEELARNREYREQFDLCCSRAVANISTLSEYCLPFVKSGGFFLSYKTDKIREELEKGKNAIHILGGGNETVIQFQLPDTEYHRVLLKIEKIKPTPKKYPRKAGTPSKDPL